MGAGACVHMWYYIYRYRYIYLCFYIFIHLLLFIAVRMKHYLAVLYYDELLTSKELEEKK